MRMAKDSFVLYTKYHADTRALSDEEMGRLIRTIFDYVGEDKLPDIDYLGPAASMAFSFIRSRLDVDIAAYEEKCKKNKENASKGGKAKAENRRLANGSERYQTEAKPSEAKRWLHDSESEYVCENDCEYEGEYECEGVIDALARELSLPPSFYPKVNEWFAHKTAKSGEQTDAAIKSLLKLIKKSIGQYGESAVAGLIDYSISHNYGSLYFDRLEQKQERSVESGQNGYEPLGGRHEGERYGTHL